MPLVSYKINVVLTWSANCVISSGAVAHQAATFAIVDTKFYIPVVTLSTQGHSRLQCYNWRKELFWLALKNDLETYNNIQNGATG